MSNQKTPTTILLTPDRKFHSFGYAARDFYHDLDPSESKHWLYLEKFKMKLHTSAVRTHIDCLLGGVTDHMTVLRESLSFQHHHNVHLMSHNVSSVKLREITLLQGTTKV